jgi:hypothetical protein
VNPGFLALYKRGNYFKRDLNPRDPNEERKREERERFAMAAIGFCLKYDPRPHFRRHFAGVVCGLKSRQTPRITDIQVEQKFWGDLVLRMSGRVYVVEGKIKAALQGKQDPTKARFWSNGYGAAILQRFGDEKRIHYVILGYPRKLHLKPDKRINCSQVFWGKLAKNYPQDIRNRNNDLASDLASCLSALEVDAFYLRETKNMKIKNPEKTAQALTTLDAVRRRIGLRKREAKFTTAFTSDWAFGYNVYCANRNTRNGGSLADLRKLISPKRGDPIAWFGYETDELGRGRRSIWFFCGNKSARQKLLRKLNRSSRLRSSHILSDQRNEASGALIPEAYVCIIERGVRAKEIPDQKWFGDAFRAAGLNTVTLEE